MKKAYCKCGCLMIAGCLAALLWSSPFRAIILDLETIINHFQMMGIATGFLFILAHILATLVGLPGSILVIAGGAIFGVFWGTVWSVFGATTGAIAAFYLARYLLRDWVEQRFHKHSFFIRLKQTVQSQRLKCVFFVRFVPISPFSVINFMFGLTPIDLRSYATGTFFGIIPGTLAYTWAGATGQDALQGENLIGFFSALGFLILLSIIPLYLRSRN